MADGNGRKRGGQQIELDELTGQALQLRRMGLTYDSIARAMGLTGRNRAHELVQRGLKRIVVEPATELRKDEDERLQQIGEAMAKAAFDSRIELDQRIKAANTLLRVHDKRAKLWGIESPIKVAQTDADGNSIRQRGLSAVDELMQLVETLQERQRAIASGADGNGKN